MIILKGLKRIKTEKLTITLDYMDNWGEWETFRELVQNWLDEDRVNCSRPEFEDGFLVLENNGKLGIENLLLGGGNKKDDANKRGQFGEGLKLACSVAVREKKKIFIWNDDEILVPIITKWNNIDVLGIRFYKAPESIGKVKVFYEMTEENFKEQSLKILDFVETNKVKTQWGYVLTDKDRRGRIYVKGIEVQTINDNLKYGYDLHDIPTDRDRNMVDINTVRREIAYAIKDYIISTTKGSSFEVLSAFFDLDNYYESNVLVTFYSAVGDFLKIAFVGVYGENSIAVLNREEATQVAHYGYRAIVVPKFFYQIFDSLCLTFSHIARNELDSTEVNMEDLSEVERTNYSIVIDILKKYDPFLELIDNTIIVNFGTNDTLGCFMRTTKITSIARQCLKDKVLLLRVLAHEYTHLKFEEGSTEHEDAMMDSLASILLGERGTI